MKVDSASSQSGPAKISDEEVRKKIAAKFGDKALAKSEKKKEDTAEISKKSQELSQTETKIVAKEDAVIGDIGKNDPKNTDTQEKLKGLLRSGAFSFNEKERGALQEILGKGMQLAPAKG